MYLVRTDCLSFGDFIVLVAQFIGNRQNKMHTHTNRHPSTLIIRPYEPVEREIAAAIV